MQLCELVKYCPVVEVIGSLDHEVSDLFYDSRQAMAGGLFFALSGLQADGHDYVPQAVAGGASAVVVERQLRLDAGVTQIVVADSRRAMATMAAAFFGFPARRLLTVGVTGTNGKTTMTYLVEALLRGKGYRPAVVGTISNRMEGFCEASSHTTPESLDLQRLLSRFLDLGADALVIEVSSHALQQGRVLGLEFAVGVFTNLTPEHLDYHGEMEAYFAAKQRLFMGAEYRCAHAVINTEHAYGRELAALRPEAFTVAISAVAQIQVRDFEQDLAGLRARLMTPAGELVLNSKLVGRFNLENLCCAVGVGLALEMAPDAITAALSAVTSVPGRLERVDNELGALIVVDYAHTGDALEKALEAVSALHPARIITLFGCGGDRDTRKRPLMGAIATRYSWLTVVTADNPRTEDPKRILEQICAGIQEQGGLVRWDGAPGDGQRKGYVVIEERREAIRFAVAQLQPGDLLLVAGKGHEDYQIIGRQKFHFDDREELRNALEAQR
ncbi:MAG: UDP-N-acetylmuramoyl-L-alanyl-D-glutamate--2,6-diaminopimelate ligase [Desulfuromonadaceae bacterium]|nr:UDP-N-acetylmuramoyl-L-alanyl-D-glutamate--2,6-diaminopimelate ligase [Desulfuromonadaceae bacterium]